MMTQKTPFGVMSQVVGGFKFLLSQEDKLSFGYGIVTI